MFIFYVCKNEGMRAYSDNSKNATRSTFCIVESYDKKRGFPSQTSVVKRVLKMLDIMKNKTS